MTFKLEISPDFTLEDIRKIRDYNYEITKNMTTNERIDYYNKGAESFKKEFEKFKERKRNNHAKA